MTFISVLPHPLLWVRDVWKFALVQRFVTRLLRDVVYNVLQTQKRTELSRVPFFRDKFQLLWKC